MEYVNENIKTEVKYNCDVFVAGGGVAGIAASLAAARQGADVLLCEHEYALGGLATLGIVTYYLPICDGCGNQMSFGIAEELLMLSRQYDVQEDIPDAWLNGGTKEEKAVSRFQSRFNPHMFEILAECLLIDAGVKILYGTTVCGVKKDGEKITHIIIENKSGRSAVAVSSVVDATGDADVCKQSGAKTALTETKNPLAAWYYAADENGVELKMLGFADTPEGEAAGVEKLSDKKYTGIDAEENSEFITFARRSIFNDVMKIKKQREKYELVTVPGIPQLRMTRRIEGVKVLGFDDREKHFEDSIGAFGSWRQRNVRGEVPFSCLYGKEVKNLITAGRCISASGPMWDLTRVIPVCAVTGEAAGTAASMSSDFAALSVEKLQEKLKKSGVKLHICDCL